jgi:hypothetical protein
VPYEAGDIAGTISSFGRKLDDLAIDPSSAVVLARANKVADLLNGKPASDEVGERVMALGRILTGERCPFTMAGVSKQSLPIVRGTKIWVSSTLIGVGRCVRRACICSMACRASVSRPPFGT